MAEPTPSEKLEQWDSIFEQGTQGVIKGIIRSEPAKFLSTLVSDIVGTVVGILISLIGPIGVAAARAIVKAEDIVAPELSDMAATAVNDMFGVNVPASAFDGGIRHGRRESASDALAAGLLSQLTGESNSPEPSDQPARRYVGVIVNMALEGWYQKWFLQFLSNLMPENWRVGQLENFGSLDDKMSEALGLGRLSRRVLGPIIDAAIVNPLEWHVHKQYRPNLLSVSDSVRQFLRGRWPEDQMREELARQGWSDSRIDALVFSARHYFGAGDVRTFVDRGHWPREQGLQHLRDQGFDEDAAADALRLEGLRRIDALESVEGTAIVTAYASRDIDAGDFRSALSSHINNDAERALLTELGELRRALNVRHLSPNEAEQCVKKGVLAVIDYRAALRRAGYTEEATLALELLLQAEIKAEGDRAEQRAAALADREAERVARGLAAEQKRQQVEADRAQRRRGRAGDLERAAVRGLIPVSRYAEVLAGDYDAETVDIMVRLVEDERQRYLDALQRADDARQRAARRGIDLGSLRSAVLEHVITVEQFRAQLGAMGFDAADADIIAATLAAQLADRDAAAQERGRAVEVARQRSIDLPRFERLVRRGARSLADYDALLSKLNFDEVSRVALRELLQIQMDDDATAAAARKTNAATTPAGRLTIDQFRRAVLLGVKRFEEFSAFLTSIGVAGDLHALLVAELQADIDAADAARAKRVQSTTADDGRALPLATVRRAARLGVVSPATYRARLLAAGYDDEDIAIELELLLAEVADVDDARRRRDAIERELAPKGLSLTDIARAVRRGATTLEEYRARAFAAGLSGEDVDLLVRVLGDELRETDAARARRAQLETDAAAAAVPLALIEERARKGELSRDDYRAQLVAAGLAPEDAELLAALVGD